MYFFAFTVPGLVGEAIAALALLALIIMGFLAIAGGRGLLDTAHSGYIVEPSGSRSY
jgi:hypothetical protein